MNKKEFGKRWMGGVCRRGRGGVVGSVKTWRGGRYDLKLLDSIIYYISSDTLLSSVVVVLKEPSFLVILL